ncbi:MAG: TetR/AcrR family transcriptional regulator [Candidatus Cryptobacteroides sp.]
MARPVTVTKEKITGAALDLVRQGGAAALTARNLTAALGCGLNPIFTAFGSIGGVLDAVREEAGRLFRKRLGAGFLQDPPFKGFGIAFLWFAMDEPELFRLIMAGGQEGCSFEEYIDRHLGFKKESMEAIKASLGLKGSDAEEALYYQLVTVALGLGFACVSGGAALDLSRASEILGRNARAFMMVIRAGADEREKYMPGGEHGPEGNLDSYLSKAIVGQNFLMQSLHKGPRYVKDGEWSELERVLRNTCSVTPESLRQDFPNLTPGDIRVYILDRLHFTVSEQALMLGISAPSVTKARQRLKAKLGGR